MAGEARVQRLTRGEQKQDCGCGCGCGGALATTRQEVIWVAPTKPVATEEAKAEQCGCTCCS